MTDSNVELDKRGRWICVSVQGDLDVELLRRLTDQLLPMVEEHAVLHVLVDLSKSKARRPLLPSSACPSITLPATLTPA